MIEALINPFYPYLFVFAVSLAAAIGLVLTRSWHGKYSLDNAVGIQKIHQSPVPRIGGIAIFLGILSAESYLPSDAINILTPMIAVGLFAFSFGLIEDLTKKVPVVIRLWATLIPGVVGYIMTGFSLTHFGFDAIDFLLQYSLISVAFTAFAVCGVTHAINLVDGFNGLAGWTAIWILAGLGLVAYQCGDLALASVAWILLASTLGFLLVNWPWGKLFLGDGGAYLLGCSIAWLAVVLVARNPQVSPFTCLLLCSYPITEALYSIYRRSLEGLSAGKPDKMHLHQLLATSLIYPKVCGNWGIIAKNSCAGFVLSLLSIPAIALAILFNQDQALLITCFGCNVLIYTAIYRWSHHIAMIQNGQGSAMHSNTISPK